jgi:hypothetical protein
MGLINEAFELSNYYQMGFLPHEGGIYDQPNILMEMIEIVQTTKAEWREKQKIDD